MASTPVALGAIKEFDPDVDRITPYLERGSLNSLDLRNGGVALYLENFNRLELLGSVL